MFTPVHKMPVEFKGPVLTQYGNIKNTKSFAGWFNVCTSRQLKYEDMMFNDAAGKRWDGMGDEYRENHSQHNEAFESYRREQRLLLAQDEQRAREVPNTDEGRTVSEGELKELTEERTKEGEGNCPEDVDEDGAYLAATAEESEYNFWQTALNVRLVD